MHDYIYRCLAAAGFAVVVASGSAHAADENAAKSERAEERASKKEKRATPKQPSRFETCRRDARGKQGPDRANFMTECLHERH